MLEQVVRRSVVPCLLAAVVSWPGSVTGQEPAPLFPDPFPSTYQPFPSQTTVIRNATILTGTGQRINGGSIVMSGGVITAVGSNVSVPSGATGPGEKDVGGCVCPGPR